MKKNFADTAEHTHGNPINSQAEESDQSTSLSATIKADTFR